VHLQDAETVHKAQLRAAIDERRPVADAVLDAADAGRSTTRSVPRVGGLVRLARVQPLGALLDVVFGRSVGRSPRRSPLLSGSRRAAFPSARSSTQS
jgi:hypothetical protein